MCSCPAHRDLVDCECQCDHTNDRLTQWHTRATAAEDKLERMTAKASDHIGDVIRQRDEAIATIERMRAAVHVADNEDVTDWQRGYRACAERAIAAIPATRTPQPGAVYDIKDPSWPPSLAFLQAYSAWLAAHGIASNETVRVEHHNHPIAAEPFIRVFQRDLATGAEREPFNVPTTTPPPSPEDHA